MGVVEGSNKSEWSEVAFVTSEWPLAQEIEFGNGVFVCLGLIKDQIPVATVSTDGAHWQQHPISTGNTPLSYLRFAGGLFMAMGPGRIATSSDGTSWERTFAGL